MLTKQTPDTIKASLKIKAMGTEQSLLLTYHNRSYEDFRAFVDNAENFKAPESVKTSNDAQDNTNVVMALYLVKSFDDGSDEAFPLTRAGLLDLEHTWPGTLFGIVIGYHQARGAAVEKN